MQLKKKTFVSNKWKTTT